MKFSEYEIGPKAKLKQRATTGQFGIKKQPKKSNVKIKRFYLKTLSMQELSERPGF